MLNAECKLLLDEVEADETLFGGVQQGGKRSRGVSKSVVVIAVETKRPKDFGRVRMRHVPDTSGTNLLPFVRNEVTHGAVVLTDGWNGYNGLHELGYARKATVLASSGNPAHVAMPGVYRIASLLMRWILGSHLGSIVLPPLKYLTMLLFALGCLHSPFAYSANKINELDVFNNHQNTNATRTFYNTQELLHDQLVLEFARSFSDYMLHFGIYTKGHPTADTNFTMGHMDALIYAGNPDGHSGGFVGMIGYSSFNEDRKLSYKYKIADYVAALHYGYGDYIDLHGGVMGPAMNSMNRVTGIGKTTSSGDNTIEVKRQNTHNPYASIKIPILKLSIDTLSEFERPELVSLMGSYRDIFYWFQEDDETYRLIGEVNLFVENFWPVNDYSPGVGLSRIGRTAFLEYYHDMNNNTLRSLRTGFEIDQYAITGEDFSLEWAWYVEVFFSLYHNCSLPVLYYKDNEYKIGGGINGYVFSAKGIRFRVGFEYQDSKVLKAYQNTIDMFLLEFGIEYFISGS